MLIAILALYAAGTITVSIFCFFLICLGGRNPRPYELPIMLAVIFLWPIVMPVMAVKLFYQTFCK